MGRFIEHYHRTITFDSLLGGGTFALAFRKKSKIIWYVNGCELIVNFLNWCHFGITWLNVDLVVL